MKQQPVQHPAYCAWGCFREMSATDRPAFHVKHPPSSFHFRLSRLWDRSPRMRTERESFDVIVIGGGHAAANHDDVETLSLCSHGRTSIAEAGKPEVETG